MAAARARTSGNGGARTSFAAAEAAERGSGGGSAAAVHDSGDRSWESNGMHSGGRRRGLDCFFYCHRRIGLQNNSILGPWAELRSYNPTKQNLILAGLWSDSGTKHPTPLNLVGLNLDALSIAERFKRMSSFPANSATCVLDESKLQLAKVRGNPVNWWNPSLPDSKCKVNEDLERKFHHMASSVHKMGMLLDSVQTDVMQLNRAMKETSLDSANIQKKFVLVENSLQQILKGQDDLKALLEGGPESDPEQLSVLNSQTCKMDEICPTLPILKEVQADLRQLKADMFRVFTKEVEGVVRAIGSLNSRPDAVQAPTDNGKSLIAQTSVASPLVNHISQADGKQTPVADGRSQVNKTPVPNGKPQRKQKAVANGRPQVKKAPAANGKKQRKQKPAAKGRPQVNKTPAANGKPQRKQKAVANGRPQMNDAQIAHGISKMNQVPEENGEAPDERCPDSTRNFEDEPSTRSKWGGPDEANAGSESGSCTAGSSQEGGGGGAGT